MSLIIQRLAAEHAHNSSLPLSELINRTFVWDRWREEACPRKSSIRGVVLTTLQRASETVPFEKKLRVAIAQAVMELQRKGTIDGALPPALALRLRAELKEELEDISTPNLASQEKNELQTLAAGQAAVAKRERDVAIERKKACAVPSLIHRDYDQIPPTLESCQILFGLKEPENTDFLELFDSYFARNVSRKPADWEQKRAQIEAGLKQEQAVGQRLFFGSGELVSADERKETFRAKSAEFKAKIDALQPGDRAAIGSSYGQRKMTFFTFWQLLQQQPVHFIENSLPHDLSELLKDTPCENPEQFARILYRLIIGRLQLKAAALPAKLDPLFCDNERKLPQWAEDLLPEILFQNLESLMQKGAVGATGSVIDHVIGTGIEKLAQGASLAVSPKRGKIADQLEPLVVDWIQKKFLRLKADHTWSGANEFVEDLRQIIPPAIFELAGLDTLFYQGPIWIEFEKAADGTFNAYIYSSGFALERHLTDRKTGKKFRVKRLTNIAPEKLTQDYFFHLLSHHHEGLWDSRKVAHVDDFYEGLMGHLQGIPEHNLPQDAVETLPVRTLGQLATTRICDFSTLFELKMEKVAMLLRSYLNHEGSLILSDPAVYQFAKTTHRSLQKELSACTNLLEGQKANYQATLDEIEIALAERTQELTDESIQEALYRKGLEGGIHEVLKKGGVTREEIDAWRGTIRFGLGKEVGDLVDHIVTASDKVPFPKKEDIKPSQNPYGWDLETYSGLYATFAKDILALAMGMVGLACGGWYRLLSLPMAYRLASSLLAPSIMESVDLVLNLVARMTATLAMKVAQKFLKPQLESLTKQVKNFTGILKNEEGSRRNIPTHNIPHFVKAPNQSLPALEGHSGYLILQNNDGAKKVVLEQGRYIPALAWRGAKYTGAFADLVLDQFKGRVEQPFVYDVTEDGELRSDEPDAVAYLLLLELLKEEDSPRLESLFQNLQEATHLAKINGKRASTNTWESVLLLGAAYNRQIPYLRQKIRTEKLALYRMRLIAHLQNHPTVFGKLLEQRMQSTPVPFIPVSLAMVLIDLRRLANQPDPRLIISKEEEYSLYQFAINGFEDLLKVGVNSFPVQIKEVLAKGGTGHFLEHFILPPDLVKRLRKVKKECGYQPTYWNRAFQYVAEFIKASSDLPSLAPSGSRHSTEPLLMETRGDRERPVLEYLTTFRKTLLQKMEPGRIIAQGEKELKADAPLDNLNFSKENLEKYFFTYYAIARGDFQDERKEALGTILACHRSGFDPHTRSLIYLLQTVYACPAAFERVGLFMQNLEKADLTWLYVRMQGALLSQKLVVPFLKYFAAYTTTQWALGRTFSQLSASGNPITKVAQEQALATVLKSGETSSYLKQGAIYLAMGLAHKLPWEMIGNGAAWALGATTNGTTVVGGLIASAGIRLMLSQLNNQPFTWRQILPMPTVTLPLLQGAVKGVRAAIAMRSYDPQEEGTGIVARLVQRGDLTKLKQIHQQWEEDFTVFREQLRQEHSQPVKILFNLQEKRDRLAQEKVFFEKQLLQIFNPIPPQLITLENLSACVHKGSWDSLKVLHLSPDLLPQTEVALNRLNLYRVRLKQCDYAINCLEKYIENRSPVGLNEVLRALKISTQDPRGVQKQLFENVLKDVKPFRLTLVQLQDRHQVIPFAQVWQLSYGSPATYHAFNAAELENALLTIHKAQREGIPFLLCQEDLVMLKQLHEGAQSNSHQKAQAARLIELIEKEGHWVRGN